MTDITEGQLIDLTFTPSVTALYRLPDSAAVSGKTIIIPTGYSPQERARIRRAINQAFADQSEETQVGDRP